MRAAQLLGETECELRLLCFLRLRTERFVLLSNQSRILIRSATTARIMARSSMLMGSPPPSSRVRRPRADLTVGTIVWLRGSANLASIEQPSRSTTSPPRWRRWGLARLRTIGLERKGSRGSAYGDSAATEVRGRPSKVRSLPGTGNQDKAFGGGHCEARSSSKRRNGLFHLRVCALHRNACMARVLVMLLGEQVTTTARKRTAMSSIGHHRGTTTKIRGGGSLVDWIGGAPRELAKACPMMPLGPKRVA